MSAIHSVFCLLQRHGGGERGRRRPLHLGRGQRTGQRSASRRNKTEHALIRLSPLSYLARFDASAGPATDTR